MNGQRHPRVVRFILAIYVVSLVYVPVIIIASITLSPKLVTVSLVLLLVLSYCIALYSDSDFLGALLEHQI